LPCACLFFSSAVVDMQWRGFQDIGAKIYTGMPLGPSAYNPYGGGAMPMGFDGFMAPFGGGMPNMVMHQALLMFPLAERCRWIHLRPPSPKTS